MSVHSFNHWLITRHKARFCVEYLMMNKTDMISILMEFMVLSRNLSHCWIFFSHKLSFYNLSLFIFKCFYSNHWNFLSDKSRFVFYVSRINRPMRLHSPCGSHVSLSLVTMNAFTVPFQIWRSIEQNINISWPNVD